MPKKEKDQQNNNTINKSRPKPSPEELKEQKRKDYLDRLDGMVEMAKSPYKTILDIYGSSGKLPSGMQGWVDYNVIPIPIPEGMNDIFVSAVTLGSMMDPSRLDRNMTSSSFPLDSDTYIGFNQLFYIENIPGNDKRMGEFPDVMLMARQDARQAVKDMAEGKDDSRVYEYLNNFIGFVVRNLVNAESYTSSDMLEIREYKGAKVPIRMAAELISTEPFKNHIEVSEFDRMKIMALANQAKAREELYTDKAKLMKEPPAAGSVEREEAVAEVMFKEYLIGILSNDRNDNYVAEETTIQGMLDKYGIDPTCREYTDLFRTPQNIVATRVAVEDNLNAYRTTDRAVLLSQPEGIETLRKLYMDSIKATNTFKDLVAAEGAELQDKLMELDNTARRGFKSFSEVRTNNEAKRYNAMMQEAFNKANDEVSVTIGNILDDVARRSFRMDAYDNKNLNRYNHQIELISEEFERNAELLPNDEHIQAIRKEMVNLKEQTRSMMKAQKVSEENRTIYMGTIDRVQQSIDAFFNKKGESPAKETEPLIMNLRRLSRNLKWSKSGIMEPENRRNRQQIFSANEGTYDKPTPEAIDSMLQFRKEDFAEDRKGAHRGRKELLSKAESATENLAMLLKSGRPLENETKQEVIGYLRDILAERVLAKASVLVAKEQIHFAERYTTSIVEKMPEYKSLTGKLAWNDVGRIAFHGGGDQLIKDYSDARLIEMFKNEQTLETKAVSDRIKEVLKERNEQAERDKYRKSAEQRKASHEDPIRLFRRYLGSKPDLHPSIRLHKEYNALQIEEIPDGLDEDTITAIVIGSIMQKDRLEDPMTTSNFAGGTSTYLAFNRNFVIDNILQKDPDVSRQGNFSLALLEGRRDALKAIEEYKNGHPEKAKEMIQTFVDFAFDGVMELGLPTSTTLIEVNASSVQKAMIQLGTEMVGKPPFYAEGPQSEIRRLLGATRKQNMQAMHRIYEKKYDILTQPKPVGSSQRAAEIEDLLFDQYLMSSFMHSDKENEKVADRFDKRMLDKYGLDEEYDPDTHYDVSSELGELNLAKARICRENHVTDIEVMMSTDEGIQKLKSLYLPEIRKTKLYKDLMTSEGNKYEDLLHASDRETKGGLQTFTNVKLDNVSKPVNDRNQTNLEKGLKELEAMADDLAVRVVRGYYQFNGYDRESLKDNVQQLESLNKLMNAKMMNDKSLPKAAKPVITELKKVVKNFVNYAKNLSKQKDPISITDMVQYELYAKDITKLSDGYTSRQTMPSEGVAKHVYLAIKRVGFLAKVNSDLITYPARIKERKLNMKEAMADRDQRRVDTYHTKHPNANTASADYRYGVLSNKALKTLKNAVLDTMEESENGASPSSRILIGKAKEAVRNLTIMISKGEDHVASHKNEAYDLLKDIFTERVNAFFEKGSLPAPEAEKTIPRLIEEMPGFKDATKNITIGTIGAFLFDNLGDKLLEKYKVKDLRDQLDTVLFRKQVADLKKIDNIEKGITEEKNEIREEKNEIREEKNEIREEKNEIREEKNEIREEKSEIREEKSEIREEKNENRIITGPDEKEQERKEQEKKDQASEEALKAAEEEMTKNSVPDSEKAARMKDTLPAPDKKKKKKGEPKRQEEPEQPKEEPKSEIKGEQPKEEPKSEIKEENPVPVKKTVKEDEKNRISDDADSEKINDEKVKTDSNDGFHKLVNEYKKEHQNEAGKGRPDYKNLINNLADMGNRIQDDPIHGPGRLVEGMDRASAQEFMKKVYTIKRTRQNLISAMMQDHENSRGPVKRALEEALVNFNYDTLERKDNKKVNSPQKMWDALQTLSLRMDSLKPELSLKYKVMLSIFGEAVKPLTDLKADIPPLTSGNAADASLEDIFRAGEGINQAYELQPMKKGEVRVAYEALENKAKAKFLLRNSLTKVTGLDINEAPVSRDPDESIIETEQPRTVHDAALRCVAKSYLARAEKENSSLEEIRGLTAITESKGFQAEVKELEKNPIFCKVASRHPNHYYSKWQKILDAAETQKEKSLAELSQMAQAGGNHGVVDYVAFGGQNAPLAILGNKDQEQLRREVRLAKYLSAKLLTTPGLTTLRQAVGSGMIKSTDIAMETLDYIEKKNIRIVDDFGRLDRDFARKLENGDFQKDMMKSQEKFVAKAKNRNPEHKKVLQNKLNSVNDPQHVVKVL